MISWSSSVGEPWVAGSIPASTSARVAVEPQALPVTRRAKLPDVAGVGSEYRDPSPTPHGAQRGARHRPAIVNVAQSAERPPCKGQVARSTRAVGSGLCGCEFIEPYNSAELSASAEHHGGTPGLPLAYRGGAQRGACEKTRDSRERTALSHRSSIGESICARIPGRVRGLGWLRTTDHRAVQPRDRRLVGGGGAGSIPAGGAPPNNGEKGRVMPARRELITRGKLGVYVGPPRAACPRGGRTPALGVSGSTPPRTSGVMRSVEVHVMRDGVQRRDCRESAATFHMEASELAWNWSDRQ